MYLSPASLAFIAYVLFSAKLLNAHSMEERANLNNAFEMQPYPDGDSKAYIIVANKALNEINSLVSANDELTNVQGLSLAFVQLRKSLDPVLMNHLASLEARQQVVKSVVESTDKCLELLLDRIREYNSMTREAREDTEPQYAGQLYKAVAEIIFEASQAGVDAHKLADTNSRLSSLLFGSSAKAKVTRALL